MINRRKFLKSVAGSFVLAGSSILLSKISLAQNPQMSPPDLPQGALEEAILEALPGKKPLIKRTYRPPNYETPVQYFNELYTPNDAFFVRYHLADIPQVDITQWKLKIGGEAIENPAEWTMEDLKRDFEQVEVTALCLCSGNRRGLFKPHVPGVQWGHGAMGNARWKGVRLKDLLSKAGIKKEALEVVFDGADGAVLEKTPDFKKSIPVWKALDENSLVAFEMNGESLPHWNGFPARLVVPGWTGTYWIKQLTEINVITKPFDGFWVKTGYRIPRGKFPIVERFTSQETDVNTPITEMMVSSLITNLEEGQQFKVRQSVEVKGIAWDGGYGIKAVEVSTDGGKTWHSAELGQDVGRFSWRPWVYHFESMEKGKYTVMAKATNRLGQTQTFELIANPAGYHHNVIQQITVNVG
jgi:DMSO/TMAO reductase YedYZ molybdopterin-dependent catalytic subunit